MRSLASSFGGTVLASGATFRDDVRVLRGRPHRAGRRIRAVIVYHLIASVAAQFSVLNGI